MTPAKPRHRLLLVAESNEDARQVTLALRRCGLPIELRQAAGEAEFVAALQQQPDVIVCDCPLAQVDVLRALMLVHEARAGIPLIAVMREEDEDDTLAIMRSGVADYVLKDQVAELPRVVQQALCAAQPQPAEIADSVAPLSREQLVVGSPAARVVVIDREGRVTSAGDAAGMDPFRLNPGEDFLAFLQRSLGADSSVTGGVQAVLHGRRHYYSADGSQEMLAGQRFALRVSQLPPPHGGAVITLEGTAHLRHTEPEHHDECAPPEWIHLQHEILGASARGEFALQFQPVFSLPGMFATAVEALLRWNHPRLGTMLPAAFPPAAERSGAILGIGDWALQRACSLQLAWDARVHSGPRVAVNVSARQVHERDFVRRVDRIVAASGVNPACIDVEISDDVILQEQYRALGALHELKSLGLQLSVDGIGIGATSIGRLKRLPINRLKLDRSLIARIPEDREESSIVSSLVRVAHDLGIRVVAVGVERDEQVTALQDIGCDEAQVFCLGRPTDAAALLSLPVAAH